jgi:hypothetical protein
MVVSQKNCAAGLTPILLKERSVVAESSVLIPSPHTGGGPGWRVEALEAGSARVPARGRPTPTPTLPHTGRGRKTLLIDKKLRPLQRYRV